MKMMMVYWWVYHIICYYYYCLFSRHRFSLESNNHLRFLATVTVKYWSLLLVKGHWGLLLFNAVEDCILLCSFRTNIVHFDGTSILTLSHIVQNLCP
jgi:hypothetical protein